MGRVKVHWLEGQSGHVLVFRLGCGLGCGSALGLGEGMETELGQVWEIWTESWKALVVKWVNHLGKNWVQGLVLEKACKTVVVLV
jgi:hypothetical protein